MDRLGYNYQVSPESSRIDDRIAINPAAKGSTLLYLLSDSSWSILEGKNKPWHLNIPRTTLRQWRSLKGEPSVF